MEIRRTGHNRPPRVVFTGVEGIGKTSFAAQFPRPFFILSRSETGLQTLIDSGQVGDTAHTDPPVADWAQLMEAVNWAIRNATEYDTLVLDTLNGVERIYYEWVLAAEFGGSAEKFSAYGRDKQYPHTVWQWFLRQLDFLQAAGKAIVALSHHDTRTFKNPEGADYDRFVPRMNAEVWKLTFAWADIVLFANAKTYVRTSEGAAKGKAIDGRERVLYTERTPAWDAKNRYRLPAEISMGGSPEEAYQNFIAVFRTAKKKQPAAICDAKGSDNISGVVVNGSSKVEVNDE